MSIFEEYGSFNVYQKKKKKKEWKKLQNGITEVEILQGQKLSKLSIVEDTIDNSLVSRLTEIQEYLWKKTEKMQEYPWFHYCWYVY